MSMYFEQLSVKNVMPEAAGAVAITFDIPAASREKFQFEPGQFLTLRATIDGKDVRRNYSISSPRSRFLNRGEIEIGIRPVEGGVFSNWAAQTIKAGDKLEVMPPDGRFVVKKKRAIHRVGFAGGSGITPILSIAATTLEEQPGSKFTLVYGNRRMSTVMFSEALQDLKDRYRDRFTMIHVLSRQAQEVELLEGLIDEKKVQDIIDALLPVGSMDEVFICGPEQMMALAEAALAKAGVPADRIYIERFTATMPAGAKPIGTQAAAEAKAQAVKDIKMALVLDGKEFDIPLSSEDRVLDAALNAGLDLPYSCKAGVCCTCRAKVLEGEVTMDKNYTLEPEDVAQGYVLTCQARALSKNLRISFDER